MVTVYSAFCYYPSNKPLVVPYFSYMTIVMKIFENALLSLPYSLHILLYELKIPSISETLYLGTEFENDRFSFWKNDP